MKHIKKIAALLLLGIIFVQSVCLTAFAAEADTEDKVPSGTSYAELPATIENYVAEHEETTVGVSVAVYDSDGVIYQNGFGYADKENNVAVDNQTVYDWGSTSKLFIWISSMQLVEQGKLDLQTDIKTYLPDGFLKNLTGSAAGTISDLLTFAQAITPNQNADCPLFEKQETLDQLYTAASYYGTSGVPNNYHGFRGLGYRLEKHG